MKVTGLTYNILNEGKITFESGKDNVDKAINFFFSFSFERRVYKPHFSPDLLWLLQSPSSRFLQYKTLILGGLKKKIMRFIPYITLDNMQMIFYREAKQYSFDLTYTFEETQDEIQQIAIFI